MKRRLNDSSLAARQIHFGGSRPLAFTAGLLLPLDCCSVQVLARLPAWEFISPKLDHENSPQVLSLFHVTVASQKLLEGKLPTKCYIFTEPHTLVCAR